MKHNKIYKTLCVITLAGLISFAPTGYSIATSRSSLNSEMDEINNKIEEKENEKAQIQNEKSQTLTEVESLIYQIGAYEREISKLDSEIGTLESKIDEAQEKLASEEEKYEKRDKEMQERLLVIYEAGDTSFLDILLGSNDIVDLISNYYIATEIAKADSEMLAEIEKKKNEIEAAKQGLEDSKNELEDIRSVHEQTSRALTETRSLKEQRANELDATERQVQEEIEAFEAHKAEIEAELRRIAEEERRNAGVDYVITSDPSSSGYIRPVSGYPITTGIYYSWGGWHGAVDFSGPGIEWAPIVAVKSGTVVTSRAAKTDDGYYYSYGEYIIINHHDGTMTLYAHGQPDSRQVFEGEEVSQGQVIMYVGTTGNSTGEHLHFEVRVDGERVDPRPYLP